MKIAIIGAGAAGLMTAATVFEANATAEFLLIDRNDGLGKKVIISGGGRCNVTTGIHDIATVLTKYPRGKEFLQTAITAFPPADVYTWFTTHGVPLKTEADLRVFPQSNDGHDVVGVFEKMFASGRVNTLLKSSVAQIEKRGEQFAITLKGKEANPLFVDKVVLTTGGQAYRQTGSTGDGYAFAQALGHSTTKLAPSLNAFFTRETWPKDISGLSFHKATFFAQREQNIFSFSGPFLFTHKGVSGPAVFALSALVAFETYDINRPLSITIDIWPDVTLEKSYALITSTLLTQTKKSLVNALSTLAPKSLIEIMLRELQLSEERRALDIGKKDIQRCARWLKAIPLTVVGRGAGDEFVTAGGVSLDEVDSQTMESKICPGLYFAGELLNVDGYTGGFNLQASWATGRLAGSSLLKCI